MARQISKHRFEITHHSEECSCYWCGSPRYVGDRLSQDAADRTFCCHQCMNDYAGTQTPVRSYDEDCTR